MSALAPLTLLAAETDGALPLLINGNADCECVIAGGVFRAEPEVDDAASRSAAEAFAAVANPSPPRPLTE